MKRYTAFFVIFMFICASFASAAEEKLEYWDNGKVRVRRELNQMGDPEEVRYYRQDGTLEQLVKYDMDGNKTAEGYFGENGKLKEGPDGWAAMRWKYVDGKMRGEAYYGSDGKLKEFKRYNDTGDMVARKYVGDKDPDPAEEYGPTPSLSGDTDSFYDSYGRPEGTTSVEYYDDWFPWWWMPDAEREDWW